MNSRYDKFTSLILNINRSIQKIKNMEMNEFGLKGNQVQCVFHLYQNPKGYTLNELCSLCLEDKGALSRSLSELEARGLIVQNESDKKYKKPYVLTTSGRKLGKNVYEKSCEMVEKGSSGIAEGEREQFYANLEKVNKNLQKVCEDYRSNG